MQNLLPKTKDTSTKNNLSKKIKIITTNLDELVKILKENEIASFRAKQIIHWLHIKNCYNPYKMHNLNKDLQTFLDDNFCFKTPEIVKTHTSNDKTQKFLMKLDDNKLIECVVIPTIKTKNDKIKEHNTLCISSQVGCGYACKFCASGMMGFDRNLTADEIIFQLYLIEEKIGKNIDNIVFMGMGEPLANYANVVKAIKIFNMQNGRNFSARRITISTCGLVNQIKKLANEPLNVRLAISLHGASDEIRNKIMPINKKHPLEELLETLKFFRKHNSTRITFEYILLANVNDDEKSANDLIKLTKQIYAHVNIIPYNEIEGLEWKRPSTASLMQFSQILKENSVNVTIRKSRGNDKNAACGQLAKQETK